jgi:hypothetical protein
VLIASQLADLLSWLTGARFSGLIVSTWNKRDRRRAEKWCDETIGLVKRCGRLRTLPGNAVRVVIYRRGRCL